MNMRVFISGRVTGLPYDQVRQKFLAAENLLRASNHNPVNPLKHVNCLADPREAMKICIPLLLECDAILLLADSIYSEGAQIEAQLARYAGLSIIIEDDLT
jgi:hypothetical protein